MRRRRTTSPSHATSALTVLTLLDTLTACSVIGANAAVAASPPAHDSHQSGIVLIESQAELYRSGDLSEVLTNYDLIGFNPRGIGQSSQSTPVTC